MVSYPSLVALAASLFVACQAEGQVSSTTPIPRYKEHSWMSVAQWYRYHAEDVEAAAKGEAKIVFVGDSITQGYENSPAWNRDIEPLGAVNFAIGGDKTQELLWRLQNGATGKLNPDLAVMLIGVNNFLHDNDSAQLVFAGVKANLEQLQTSYPRAHILILGVFPYGEKAEDPNRERVSLVNEFIKTLASENVSIIDIGDTFLEEDGTISKEIMGDFLHPSHEGYERMTDVLLPHLKEILTK